MSTKPSRRLTEERVAFLLGLQTQQNREVVNKSLAQYAELVIDPLAARINDLTSRLEALETPWYKKLWRRVKP